MSRLPIFFSKNERIFQSISKILKGFQNLKGITFSKQVEKRRISFAFSPPQKGYDLSPSQFDLFKCQPTKMRSLTLNVNSPKWRTKFSSYPKKPHWKGLI